MLTLALTLSLPTGSCNEVLFFLFGNRLGIGPLLILLAFVWLTGLRDTGTKSELLLGLLGEVVSVGDAVVLGLGLSSWLSGPVGGSTITVTGQSFLSLGLSNGFACLLVVEFTLAAICAPSMCSLLLGFAKS